jgi:hypothetical protein
MIPQRFQSQCNFCGDPLDIRRPGVFQLTTGWVENRKGGGAHAIALAERMPHWACHLCMDKKRQGQAQYQLDLFA